MKIPDFVRQALHTVDENMVHLAESVGVHRNWLIDLRDGKVPTTRDGHALAASDARYQKFGQWLEARAIVTESEFVRLAEIEQLVARVPKKAGLDALNTAVRSKLDRLGPNDTVPTGYIWDFMMTKVREHGALQADAVILQQARRLHQPEPPRRATASTTYGAFWTPENGWVDDRVMERQVREVVDAVHAADLSVAPEIKSSIVRALTRLQYLPAVVVQAMLMEAFPTSEIEGRSS